MQLVERLVLAVLWTVLVIGLYGLISSGVLDQLRRVSTLIGTAS
jgi:hypothetical protein